MDTRGLFKTYQTSLLEPFTQRLKVCGGRSEEALDCVEKVFVAYFDSDGNVFIVFYKSFHSSHIETYFQNKISPFECFQRKKTNSSSAVNDKIELLKYRFYKQSPEPFYGESILKNLAHGRAFLNQKN